MRLHIYDTGRKILKNGRNVTPLLIYFLNSFQSPLKGVNNPYDPHNFDDYYADDYGGYGTGDGGQGKGGGFGGPGGRGGGGGGGGGGGMPPRRDNRAGPGDMNRGFPPPPRGGPRGGGGGGGGMSGGPPDRGYGGNSRGGGGGGGYEGGRGGYGGNRGGPPPYAAGNYNGKRSSNRLGSSKSSVTKRSVVDLRC